MQPPDHTLSIVTALVRAKARLVIEARAEWRAAQHAAVRDMLRGRLNHWRRDYRDLLAARRRLRVLLA